MQSVGIYEAKSRFSALIELVEQGEEVRITRHGKEVVRMLPVRRRPVITDERNRTANITVEGAEVTAVRCDIQTYYAVLATITYDSGDVVYVSALTKLASINDIVNLVESVSLS